LIALVAWALAGAALAQEPARPRVGGALARTFVDSEAAARELRRQAASPRARAGELRVIAEAPRGLTSADLPLDRIRALGARVDGVGRTRVRIAGSPAVLARVAELTGIATLRFPLVPVPVEGAGVHISESVALTGAAALQLGGLTGAGVEVAVLDLGFWRLTEAITTGEIGPDTVTYDTTGYGIETITSHGTAVAEQVTDMAPGVKLHLVMFEDEVDFEQAVDYVNDNGIRIANLSVNWFGSSYYDDTGPINDLINESHDAHGVFWTVGGGNWAFRHWRGGWLDENMNQVLSFSPGDEQLGLIMESTAEACLVLNWNQYAGATPATDLDLFIHRTGFVPPIASGENNQNATGEPVERACFSPQAGQTYYARVERNSGPSAGLDMTIVSSSLTIEAAHRVAASSMVDPAVAHGAFAVGAIAASQWNVLPNPPIESLSSWGPTNDGRPKPELVAPDRTASLTRPGAVGTSFAAPVAAGAAALMLSQNSTLTNLQLRAGLLNAAQDVGPVVGHDNTYGQGKLAAPIVPPGPDADGDGLQDAFDLCPFEPDPLRLDANDDGIGDACQCGDLSGDGLLSSADADLLRAWLTAVAPPPAALARCNVKGPAMPLGADCRVDDWAVLERSLIGAGPGLAQVCAPALP